jgi:mannose-1-phosphate guanylyltransferase
VVPMDVGWSDVGSWAALRDAWEARAAHGATTDDRATPSGMVGRGNRMDLDSSGTLVMAGDRLVVTIGLQDIIVVDTPEALLVCAVDRSQDVRIIHQRLTDASRNSRPPAPTTARKDQP